MTFLGVVNLVIFSNAIMFLVCKILYIYAQSIMKQCQPTPETNNYFNENASRRLNTLDNFAYLCIFYFQN
jgi:hypothetical protein